MERFVSPPRFDESFAHDLTRDTTGTVECFICRRAVSTRSAFKFEHIYGPPMACHGECLQHTAGELVIARYHRSVDRVMRDGGHLDG